jgi:hypothetical protein
MLACLQGSSGCVGRNAGLLSVWVFWGLLQRAGVRLKSKPCAMGKAAGTVFLARATICGTEVICALRFLCCHVQLFVF